MNPIILDDPQTYEMTSPVRGRGTSSRASFADSDAPLSTTIASFVNVGIVVAGCSSSAVASAIIGIYKNIEIDSKIEREIQKMDGNDI